MITRISAFQPIGDAASELRAVIPNLVQSQAVNILRNAEAGYTWIGPNDATVTFEYIEWLVNHE